MRSLFLRAICVLSLLVASVRPAAAQLDGAFTLRSVDNDDRLGLNLVYDGHSNYGRMVPRSALTDVVRTGDRITFTLRREPGTFTFEGRGSLDRASGWYGFAPNQGFAGDLAKLGFRGVETRALLVFALEDLTVTRVRQLQQMVSNTLDTEELVRLIDHGAGFGYIQAMTDLGFKKLSSEDYRRARDHGVSESFVREMAGLGMKLSLEDLIRSRDHGVTPEYVRAMRSAGLQATQEDLVRARDHGVSAEFLRQMRDLGYSKLTTNELVRLRDHGVTATYVRRVKDLLKEPPSVEELIQMRSQGAFGSR